MLIKLSRLLLLLALPLMLTAQVQLSQANGTIAGTGHARTHDFPVILEEFTITVSALDDAGYRTIEVTVPVKQITTESGMRDTHMKTSMFKPKKYPNIVYRATTMADLTPGSGILSGQLTIRDVTHDLDLDVQVSELDMAIHVTGSFVIVPTEYDLPLVGMGPMKVLDHIELDFDITVPAL